MSGRRLLSTLHMSPASEPEHIEDGDEFLYMDVHQGRGRYVRLRFDREGVAHLERAIADWHRDHPAPDAASRSLEERGRG